MKYNEYDGNKLDLAMLELCMRKLYFEANRKLFNRMLQCIRNVN